MLEFGVVLFMFVFIFKSSLGLVFIYSDVFVVFDFKWLLLVFRWMGSWVFFVWNLFVNWIIKGNFLEVFIFNFLMGYVMVWDILLKMLFCVFIRVKCLGSSVNKMLFLVMVLFLLIMCALYRSELLGWVVLCSNLIFGVKVGSVVMMYLMVFVYFVVLFSMLYCFCRFKVVLFVGKEVFNWVWMVVINFWFGVKLLVINFMMCLVCW